MICYQSMILLTGLLQCYLIYFRNSAYIIECHPSGTWFRPFLVDVRIWSLWLSTLFNPLHSEEKFSGEINQSAWYVHSGQQLATWLKWVKITIAGSQWFFNFLSPWRPNCQPRLGLTEDLRTIDSVCTFFWVIGVKTGWLVVRYG